MVDEGVRQKLRARLREKRSQRVGTPLTSEKTKIEKMVLESDDPHTLNLLQQVVKNPTRASPLLQEMKGTIVNTSVPESSEDEEEGLPPRKDF